MSPYCSDGVIKEKDVMFFSPFFFFFFISPLGLRLPQAFNEWNSFHP